MEEWRRVFRVGLLPLLGRSHLEALRDALERDDPQLLQGATTTPPPLQCMQDWPADGACLIGYAGWRGGGLNTVGEVNEYFAAACAAVDARLDEPAGVRWLLNTFDEWPRDRMRAELLPEILRGLALLDAAGPEKAVTR